MGSLANCIETHASGKKAVSNNLLPRQRKHVSNNVPDKAAQIKAVEDAIAELKEERAGVLRQVKRSLSKKGSNEVSKSYNNTATDDGARRDTVQVEKKTATRKQSDSAKAEPTKASRSQSDKTGKIKKKANVKLSVTKDESSWFEQWTEGAEVIEDAYNHQFKDGEAVVVKTWHGTTHEFDTIAPEQANIENHFGRGLYLTSSEHDVRQNYEGTGPDLTNRIDYTKEQIESQLEYDIDEVASNYDEDIESLENEVENEGVAVVAERLARKKLIGEHGESGKVMDLFVKMKNPMVVSPSGGTEFYQEIDWEYYENEARGEIEREDFVDEDGIFDEDEYEDEIRRKADEIYSEDYNPSVDGNVSDLEDAIRSASYSFEGADAGQIFSDLQEEFDYFEQPVNAQDLFDKMRSMESVAYIEEGEYGQLASSEFIRTIVENMGYDGIIMDADYANQKWNMDVPYGTWHFITWNPNNVKSVSQNNGEYSLSDNNIYKSQSEKESKIHTDVNAELSSALGRTWNRILKRGNVGILKTQDEAKRVIDAIESPDPLYSKAGMIQGFSDGKKVYLVEDGIAKGNAVNVLAHELGVHLNRLGFKSDKEFQSILKIIEQHEGKDTALGKAIAEAVKRVPKDTNPAHRTEEILAYMVETGKDTGPVRRFIALVKKWLVKIGITPSVFNSEDFRSLAMSAIKSGETTQTNEDVKQSASNPFQKVTRKTLLSYEFKNWFGRSKMRNIETGVPFIFYHGSPEEFFAFDNDKVGKGGHTSSGLGHFFSLHQKTAKKYAKGGKVTKVYLKLENPYIMKTKEAQSFKTVAESKKRREELMAQGYDGVVMDFRDLNAGAEPYIIVFESNQVKSAEFNTGEFSATNDDIRYSMSDEPVQGSPEDVGFMAKQEIPEIITKKLPVDSGLLSRIFSSFEYTAKKSPTAWRLVQKQYNRMMEKVKLEDFILGNKVNEEGKKQGFVTKMQEGQKKFAKDYKVANSYLLDTDKTGNTFTLDRKSGYRILDPEGNHVGYAETKVAAYEVAQKAHKAYKAEHPESKRLIKDYQTPEGEWWRVVGKEGEEVAVFEDDQTAATRMMDEESNWLRENKYSEKSIELVREYREMTNRGFDKMIEDLRQILADVKEAGMDEPTVSVVDETKRWALTQNGKVIGTFETEDAARQAGGRRHNIKKQVDSEIRKEMKLSEVIAVMSDLRGLYFARQRQRGSIIMRAVKGNDKVMKKYDFHMLDNKYIDSTTGEEFKRPVVGKLKKVVNIGLSKIPGTLANEAGALQRKGYSITVEKDTSLPESVFDAVQLASSISAVLSEATSKADKKGADRAALAEMSKILTGTVADIFKQRGYLSSRLKRQKDYWGGFETDMLLSGTQYARGLAAGLAKRKAAKEMFQVITGRDIPYDKWKEDNEDGSYEEYTDFVANRALDPKKQPVLYEDSMSFIREMLRNEEQADRILGTLQGVAVVKFLGFRLSSAAVNMTNMVQAVPATISAHTGGSIAAALNEVRKGIVAYGKFKSGKGDLSKEDRDIFLEIIDRGLDEAQFNKESVAVLQSKFGRGWSEFSEWSMKVFGAAEKVNRAVTLYAAYKQFKKNTDLSDSEAMEQAIHASNRAHQVYGKATRPVWTRGAWNPLKLPFTFAKFSQGYTMNMIEMGLEGKYKQAAYMLLSPAILAGSGASLATPVLVAAASALGVGGDDPEEEFYAWAESVFGSDRIARHGLAGLMGVNLKGSIQMNNPMPTTLSELFGAPGAIFTDTAKAYEHYKRGEIMKGSEALLPTAIGSGIKAVREGTEGVTTGSYSPVFYGNEPIKADGIESTIRFFGFNPARISGIREKQWHEKQIARKFQERRNEINAKIKRAYIYGKGDKMEVLKEIKRYNELVKGSGRKDISLIVPYKQINRIRRSAMKPNKVERTRALTMQNQ